MNKRERLIKALKGETTDRPSVFCADSTATQGQAELFGLKWPLFHQKAEEMASMALGAHEVFGFDGVRLPFCQTIEAEALGCEVGYKDFIPSNDVPLYKLDEVPEFPDDFLKRGRIPELVEGVRLLKREVNGQALVLGGVTGPLTIARALLDSVPLLKASLKMPDKIVPFLQVGQRASLHMAIALIDAGAEAIVIEDMTASPDLLHPRTYKNILAEYHRHLIQALSVPAILHICGNVTHIAEEMAKSRAAGLSIDSKAEIPALRAKVGPEMRLIGGVESVALSLWSSIEIRQMGLKALREGIDILAPGCAIPPNSPTENLKTMVRTAEEFVAE
jgi:[methyl-Co(III) methanol-specific corrinoid protein]:coenzyme M methyltransferase